MSRGTVECGKQWGDDSMRGGHNFIDLTDQIFGRLQVINRLSNSKLGKVRWLCQCNCGNMVVVITPSLRHGWTKSCGCLKQEVVANQPRGTNSPNWNGGRYKTRHGYIAAYAPEHPRARSNRIYVLEHILVMEGVLGRFLFVDETVHHKNGIRDDNRPENLELRAGQHGKGQRPADLVKWAKEILARYDTGVTIA